MRQSIMIVDDSIPLHKLIKAQLDAEDLTFHSVYDGSAAVCAAASIKPDLILLDIDMPGMDGFETCAKIKADPTTTSIPLMFLSAEPALKDQDKTKGLGAFDYMQKPFKPADLKAVVRSKLRAIPLANDDGLIDSVTGLGSKEFFKLQLREQYVLSSLLSQPLSCVIIEIDQMVSVTVRFRGKTANRALHATSRVILDSSGSDATVACLPNRRFAILYRNCDRFTAKVRCKAIQQQFKAIAIDAEPEIHLTGSFGICDSRIASAMTLMDRAVAVLQRAIDCGGERIAIARSEARKSN